MLVMEKAFSRFHSAEFHGFMMAKAEFHIHSENISRPIDLKNLRQRADGAILEVSEDLTHHNNPSYIRIMLIKPGTAKESLPDTPTISVHDSFSDSNSSGYSYVGHLTLGKPDISRFLKFTGDSNPIHQGAHPVIPGFCLLNHTLDLLEIKPPFAGSIRFLQPTFAGEQLLLYRNHKGYLAAASSGTAFLLTLKER